MMEVIPDVIIKEEVLTCMKEEVPNVIIKEEVLLPDEENFTTSGIEDSLLNDIKEEVLPVDDKLFSLDIRQESVSCGSANLSITKDKYACEKCDFSSNDLAHLRRHASLHKKNILIYYSCSKCGYKCDTASSLNDHKKSIECHLIKSNKVLDSHTPIQSKSLIEAGEKLEQCEKPLILFSNALEQCEKPLTHFSNALEQCGKPRIRKKLYKCSCCIFSCKTSTEFREHVNSDIHKLNKYQLTPPDITFSCSLCDYECFDFLSIKKHMIVHKESTYLCAQCGDKFYTKDCLALHKMLHPSLKKYQCKQCDYAATKCITLQWHVRKAHKRGELHICKRCNYSTKTYRFYRKHVLRCYIQRNKKKQMTQPEITFSCSVCDYKCTDLLTLKNHELEHSETTCSCLECGDEFFNKFDLTKHIKLHPRVKIHYCTECDFFTNCYKTMKAHKNIHDRNKLHVCTICNYESKSYKFYHKHLFSITHRLNNCQFVRPEITFSCSVCDYKCNGRLSLKKHSRKHSGNRSFSCLECGEEFYTKFHLTRHVKLIHVQLANPEITFSCSLCDYKCTGRLTLKNHELEHSGTTCSCLECGDEFFNKFHLIEHIKLHPRVKRYYCTECNFFTNRNKQMRAHSRRHKSYQCTICNYISKSHKMYWRHLIGKPHQIKKRQMVSSEIKFSCSLCDYKCTSRLSLKEHMHEHTKKTFLCMECGNGFSSEFCLKRHLKKRHPSVKMYDHKPLDKYKNNNNMYILYRCTICDFTTTAYKFYWKHINSAQHKLIKNKLRPEIKFSCSLCDYECAGRLSLKNHMWVHTGKKTCSCAECGDEFYNEFRLRRHIKLHHPTVKLYWCTKCNYATEKEISLKSHQRMVHPANSKMYTCTICNFSTKASRFYCQHIKNAIHILIKRQSTPDIAFCQNKDMDMQVDEKK